MELKKPLDHLAVAKCLISDVEGLRRKIHSLVDNLLSGNIPDVPLSFDQADHISTIQTALLQFSAFAQMVSYFNAIEPLDSSWCREA